MTEIEGDASAAQSALFEGLATEPARRGRKPQDRTERNARLCELHAQGATLDEMGDAVGVTRERARQLLSDLGLSAAGRLDRMYDSVFPARASEARELFLELRNDDAVAQEMQLPTSIVRRWVDAHIPDPAVLRRARKSGRNRWSDEEMLDSLRRGAMEVSSPMAHLEYSAWAANQRLDDGRPAPGSQGIMLRFGGWRSALLKAGLPANPTAGPSATFDADDALAAVVAAWRDMGRPPSVQAYDAWSRGRADAPSTATTRRHFDGWDEVLQLAWEVVHGEELRRPATADTLAQSDLGSPGRLDVRPPDPAPHGEPVTSTLPEPTPASAPEPSARLDGQPPVDPVIAERLLARLAASDLDEAAKAVVQRAVGAPTATASAGGTGGPSTGVFLKSIEVEGFRGIGPTATLPLDPKPGLTVVVGRNGSGKSSFAEGAELLLTGTTKRWEKKAKTWSDSWQCLHHDGPTRVAAELVVGGADEPVSIERRWDRGDAYGSTGTGDADAVLDSHRWTEALASFRPFLSYGELASMFDKLTSLYDALSPVLGLEDVDAVLGQISSRRLELEKAAKDLKSSAATLVGGFSAEDPRQAALAALLERRSPDLAAVQQHLDANPPGLSGGEGADALRVAATRVVPADDEIRTAYAALRDAQDSERALATTDAQRARRLAALLEDSVRVRDTARPQEDCPVCGTADALDGAWDVRVLQEIEALRHQATGLDAAAARTASAASAWSAILRQLDLLPDATADDAVAAAAQRRAEGDAARGQLEQLDQSWRGVVDAVTVWLAEARLVAGNANELVASKQAEKWLKDAADELRNERFAPISGQAVENWKQLRHQSNVELRAISIKSVGRRKDAIFDVRVDGEEASALGTMSQGELLALSVAVFLPRAGLDESPFRFALIDDPVQSMDPAKVEGLARVLAEAAKTRQVIVFTHDDRLPQVVKRLRLPAKVLQVHRQSRSQVAVNQVSSPHIENLKQAKMLGRSDRVPLEVRQRTVPALCRAAVEAACAHVVRERAAAQGDEALAAAEDALRDARTLRSQLNLVLLGDARSEEDLQPRLLAVSGPDAPVLVKTLSSAVHDGAREIDELHRRTEKLVLDLTDLV